MRLSVQSQSSTRPYLAQELVRLAPKDKITPHPSPPAQATCRVRLVLLSYMKC